MDREHKYRYDYKTIPSYVKHISPTFEELNIQLNSKITPNLWIDKNRYIDFISASWKLEKINYLYLFRLNQDLSNVSSFDWQLKKVSIQLDKILDLKTEEIKQKINSNNPSQLTWADLDIYEKYLKITNYPNPNNFNLKEFIKTQPWNQINISWEEKELSYYDSLVFSLFLEQFR